MEFNFEIEILKTANLDIDFAYKYYIEISPKLATRFISEVKTSINSLKKFPFYQFREKSFRAIPLKNFPYLVFYEVFEAQNLIKVYRIFNTNQDPEKYP